MATYRTVTPEHVKKLVSSFLVPECPSPINDRNSETSSKRGCENFTNNGTDEDINLSVGKDSFSFREKGLNPRSREAYFKRVDTYTTFNWIAKPVDLSPLVCARFGWQVIEPDMLECVGCKAKLGGQLPKRRDLQIYPECCSKLKHGLTKSHSKSCFWSSNPCPESFAVIPLYDVKEMTQNFHARLKALEMCTLQLPVVTSESMVKEGLDEEIIESVVQSFVHEKGQTVTENAKAAFLFALCGWNLRDKAVLYCDYCQRTIGLWSYKGNNKAETNPEESDDGPEAKKFKMTEKERFDPIAEHRYWCSWIINLSKAQDELVTPITGSPGRHYTSPVSSPVTPRNSSLNTSTGTGDGSLESCQLSMSSRPWYSLLKLVCPFMSKDEEPSMKDHFKQNSPNAGLSRLRKLIQGWSPAHMSSPNKS